VKVLLSATNGVANFRVIGISFLAATILLQCWIPSRARALQDGDPAFPEVFNTEAAGEAPPAAEEMVKFIELPKNFSVSLFAGEPQVQQPICLDFDDRGRLWVAECYSYSGGPYETKLHDRIVILEDIDQDGRHDKRTVFWDKGFMLTSLAWGFGGLWILHDGTLSFIPDKNGDDLPDSEPITVLDGWSKECGHNFVSGLLWGPDGWLYGRHGIVDTSYPGIPGTPKEQRVAMNCGVWRYHPVSRIVESVCYGTTNPWGLDYDQNGQFFMTNNVQGHLWHCLPGAHFKRMYGQDFNPHFYELMDMTADHYHWDTTRKWNESRDGVANDLGGGHSHVGGLIYQGTNFPAEYRGKMFMCNTHGRRINVNRLERHGSGFVGKREPDFMLVKSPWFRGVDIKVGPDGSMYIADWSDNGECHDHDGIHRTSGRIYRIVYQQPHAAQAAPGAVNVAQLSTESLLELISNENAWYARRALRLLQERILVDSKVKQLVASQGNHLPILAAEALGLNDIKSLRRVIGTGKDPEQLEHAVQLAGQTQERRSALLDDLKSLAKSQPADNVLMSLISVLRRFELKEREELANAILSRSDNTARIANEENLTLMTWFGIEPFVRSVSHVKRLDAVPRVQQFAVRRLAYEVQGQSELVSGIMQMAANKIETGKEADAAAVLQAFRLGLAGRVRVEPPKDWETIKKRLSRAKSSEVGLAVDALSVLLGDGAALNDLRILAADGNRDVAARESAIDALAQARDLQVVPVLFNLLSDRAVADAAIRALASFDHPDAAKQLLNQYANFKDGNGNLAIDTLASRVEYALPLMDAIESDKLPAKELSATQVRQLLALGHERIEKVLAAKWGALQETPQEKLTTIDKWQQQLSAQYLSQADLESGAALFKKSCANCHKLYGEGQTIGPDLTGSNRGSLEYVLMNIIDPSSIVPKQFTTSTIVMNSGRVVTGVIVGQTEMTFTVQTEKEQLSLLREEVEQVRDSNKSLMPDGLLDSLSEQQVRDLVAFIMYRK
jgi:putative membrane-bound dehydrogenase-like protein